MVSDEEVVSTFEVMRQLRTHLNETEYLETIRRMRCSGYRLATVLDGGRVKCAAGFRSQDYLSLGRRLYVDDLITAEDARSEGRGQRMLNWLADEARGDGCGQINLDSGVQRHDAHRFYFREGMSISSYHFRNEL
jgi:GNAT superfamily N-acetyltransferase